MRGYLGEIVVKNRVKGTHSKLGNLSLKSGTSASGEAQAQRSTGSLVTPRAEKGTKRRPRSSTVESTPKKVKVSPTKGSSKTEIKEVGISR